MYEIGCAIIFGFDLLDKLIWLVTGLLNEPIREVLPRYRARRFFRAWDEMIVFARSTGWDRQVVDWLLDDLMSEYGYAAQRRPAGVGYGTH